MVLERDAVAKYDGVYGVDILLVRWEEDNIIRVSLPGKSDERLLEVLVTLVKDGAFLLLLFVVVIIVGYLKVTKRMENSITLKEPL